MFQQILEFFSDILSIEYWPARWHCGRWTDFHGWLYIVSELLIWASYFLIPVLLFTLTSKRTDIPFKRIFALFIAFIFLCGATHLMDAVIFWWPAYRLSALIRFATGIVSVCSVYALYRALPIIVQLPTTEQLQAEIERRKKVELELIAAKEQTEKAAKFETARLLSTIAKEQELNALKSQFVNMVSHELRTPLTGILTSAELLEAVQSMPKEAVEERSSKYIGKIKLQTSKIMDLMNKVLLLGKMEAGKIDLNLVEVDFIKALNGLISHEYNHSDKDLISLEVQGSPYKVIADWKLLSHAVTNLIGNALKYTTNDVKPVVSLIFEEKNVRVCVQDYGIGIPEPDLKQLFSAFGRASNVGNIEGTGLGLMLSKHIVQMHGGNIEVQSQEKAGSTFTMLLPRFQEGSE